jgi:ABC-type multidrug transport system fused ATPase/permease subunit
LARKPQLLILDEATSALDNESEIKIQKVIEELKGKITVLAVAHRLSTLLNSDRILVIHNGKIIEQGNPQELLKDENSYFYKTYYIREGKP